MLLGRRKTLRICSYGGVLVTIFLLFSVLQVLVSRDNESIGIVTVTNTRVFAHDTELTILDYSAADDRLVNHVRNTLIQPYQGTPDMQYNLTMIKPNSDYSRGQSKIIDEHLQKKYVGYYIDVGAGDGESNSVTLFFEKERSYNGLLIEPYPGRYMTLLTKNRRANTLQACVRTNKTGSLKEYLAVKQTTSSIVPCLWMETIVAATGKNTIDVLSINVREQELEILGAIPFDKLNISVVSIEFSHNSSAYLDVIRFMSNINYVAIHQFVYHPLHKVDVVFAKKSKVKK
ncbi:uncharacterized protein LOC110461501 [Mizuhopecten yessoensis]|uniref:Protein Star n=1 Tax=Mizuhopecten yessoensis TaxID=6573 RepID=A0A210Q0B9_MIZYE|nr:uncharacterized protein LOC110461501 [Mizuhopecten yessoensis]XP_021370657.1 uncharacterized protein LOC110461501 [Mizuhopecten yessoensis]XP_021370658.1 uncharacterized protein LOC110461501 [Mizuhopecten yessoensis]XP_021370659.1 uncharacterized protein LOC110461501 [Mizuhopecten yessoensis]XP_021370660.1 uncharacterized protein LOC110461501 [Mizuhopecten yessoensis]OWF42172.1 Protein Star [Mizuhopecten yessoensis]